MPSLRRESSESDENEVGFAYHHPSQNQNQNQKEESPRTTMSTSCSTDFEQEIVGPYNDYSTQECRPTRPGYESETTHPPQGMKKNPSSCYHHHIEYDEKRSSDDSVTRTNGRHVAKKQKDNDENEER